MPYIGNQHNVGDHVNNFKVLDDISSHTATFDGSATSVIDTTNNTIRVPLHRFIQGQRVTYTNGGGGNIGGLTTGTAYFVSFDSANTIKLATTLANANSNTVINLSAVGSGTSHTLNAAFDGVNTKFKMTHGSGKAARLNNATQLNVAINNVIQRPNLDPNNFTDGFAIEDNHKIVFKTAPTVNDVFWGSIIANTIENFDLRDNEVDNFTGDGSTTEFTLSTIPANNESVIVSINGVVQHPSDKNTARSYTLIDSIIQFTAAPAIGDGIQVRHIGFAGASTNDVSGFYGRTGNVALTSSDHITTGDITPRNINASGIITASSFDGTFSSSVGGSNANFTGIVTAGVFKGGDIEGRNLKITGLSTFVGDASFTGNVSIGGTLTYEDVTNIDSVGIITAQKDIHVGAGLSVVGVTTLTGNILAGGTSIPGYSGADDLTIGNETGHHGITIRSGATNNGGLFFSDDTVGGSNSNQWAGGIEYNHPTSDLRFYVGNGWKFSFTGAGHYIPYINSSINIGTNSKRFLNVFANYLNLSSHATISGDLDVDGHTNLDNVSVAGVTTFTGNINSNGRLLIGTTTEGHADADDFTIGTSTNSAGITIRTNTSGTGRLFFSDGTSGAAEYQGYIQYDHANQRLSLGSGGATRLIVNSNGRVGVGTDDTQTQFQVGVSGELSAGDINRRFVGIKMANSIGIIRSTFYSGKSGDYAPLQIHVRDGIAMHIDADTNRNIGIGTDDPDTKLEVFAGTDSIQVGNQSGSGRFGADGTSTKLGSHSNHHLDLFTNGSSNTRLRISSTGKVGVNNNNPNAYDQFVVSGTGNIIAASSTSGYAGIGFYEGATGRFFLRTLNGSNGLGFYPDNSTQTLTIASDGKATIKCTSNEEIFRIETSAGNPGNTQGKAYMGFDHFNGSTKPAILIGSEEEGNASYKGSFVIRLKDAAATDDDPVERLRIKSNGHIVLGSDGTNSELTFTQDGTSGTQLNATTTGSGGYNTLSINSATLIHKYGVTERVRINSSGEVSVANAAPSSGGGKLNVKPNDSVDSYFKIRNAADFDGTLIGNVIDNRNSANNASQDLIIRSAKLVLWQGTNEALRILDSNHIQFNGTSEEITLRTSDGSDNGYMNLSGGGACSQNRGAQLVLSGNERSSNGGLLQLLAGNSGSATGKIQMYTGGNERLVVQDGGVLSQRVNSNARFSHGILEITSSSSPSQLKIKTNIPYSGFSHAESVTIRGFRYGGRDTVDIQICWHVYGGQFYNRIASSSGGWAPTITLAVESGKVVIHFDSLGYWHKIYVADYYSAYGDYDYARGWTYDFSAINGDSGLPVNTVPYKNDWGGLTYNDNHNAGGGDLNIHDGNLILASGHGIDFSATANAGGGTMGSELLDDYEEGSWTPNYSRPNMTLTYGYREGYYTKVGRTVHVVGRLYTTSESGSSTGGPILVTGLPYTVRGTRCALSVRPANWSHDHPSFATFELNQTHFELLEEVEGNPSGSQDLTGTRFAGGNGNYLWFGGSYITDT